MAYGVYGLTPEVFWNLTFREFALIGRGHREKLREQQWTLAWQTALLLSPYSKKPIRVGDLMGEKPKPKTRQDALAEARYLKKLFKDRLKNGFSK